MQTKEYEYRLKNSLLFLGLGAFFGYLIKWFIDKSLNNDLVKLKGIELGDLGSSIFLWLSVAFSIVITLLCLAGFFATFYKRKAIIDSGTLSIPKAPYSRKRIILSPSDVTSSKIESNGKIQTLVIKSNNGNFRLPSVSVPSKSDFEEIAIFIAPQLIVNKAIKSDY